MSEALVTRGITSSSVPRPLVWRVVHFPLVAMLLATAAMVLILGGLSWATTQIVGDLGETQIQIFNGIATPLLAILVYKLVVARLGEEPRDDLPLDGRLRDLGGGTIVALVLMSAIVGLVALAGGYRVAGWGGATSWPLVLFVAGTQAAVLEEILIRGILFRFLEEFGGSWLALVVSAAVFGFGHAANPNATLFSSLTIAIMAGIMLGGAYMLTRNLWLAIGIHFGWNVTQGLIYDVPVSGVAVDGVVEASPSGDALISGGAFGVEASVIALVVATSYGVWLVMRAMRKGHVVRPWWVRRRLGLALPD